MTDIRICFPSALSFRCCCLSHPYFFAFFFFFFRFSLLSLLAPSCRLASSWPTRMPHVYGPRKVDFDPGSCRIESMIHMRSGKERKFRKKIEEALACHVVMHCLSSEAMCRLVSSIDQVFPWRNWGRLAVCCDTWSALSKKSTLCDYVWLKHTAYFPSSVIPRTKSWSANNILLSFV